MLRIRFYSPLLLVFALFLSSCSSYERGSTNTTTDPALASKGMVSTAHPLATEAGLKVLENGGNAFDAAIAIATTLNVVEPHMSGAGGYGTILVYDAETERSRFLNPSGRIPANVNSDLYRAPTPDYMQNRRRAKAVSTPGNVNAWESLWKEYGTKEWSSLFENAIDLARNGYVLDDQTARYIAGAYDEFSDYTKGFYGKNGKPLESGETLIQKDLATSFEAIARDGARAFHGGTLGAAVDAVMKERGGFLNLQDLLDNEAEWWDPISIDYRGFTVITASPPANSWPALLRLGMMENFDLREMGHNSTEYMHTYAEVTKHAFWARLNWAGDPDIAAPPLTHLLSEAYMNVEASNIDPNRATRFTPPTDFTKTGDNTTHFVVADQWGNVVSATQTLGNAFGSRIMAEGTGIWLNNSLQYSTFEPKGNPMDAFPGRHKLSGDVPMFVFKGDQLWLALGTPGGHTIAQNVPQIVMNMIDFDMDIQRAILAPKITFVEPNSIGVEQTISQETVDNLTARGHQIRRLIRIGNAHGLVITYSADGKPMKFEGGSDPRGIGTAQGID